MSPNPVNPAAQPPNNGPRRPRGGFGPIELSPDDVAVYDAPPQGFKEVREDVPHGKLEMIEYESKTVGTMRKTQVYTPPGYTLDQKYPILYLLHGIGGDGKAIPMIVVMPNGRAQKNDRAEGDVMKSAPAFATFEQDLLNDLIPAIESRYSVDTTVTIPHIGAAVCTGSVRLSFRISGKHVFRNELV